MPTWGCYCCRGDGGEGCGWGWRLFEARRLLNFPPNRMGAYSRQELIWGWALNRINTLFVLNRVRVPNPQRLIHTKILEELSPGLVRGEINLLHFLGVEGNFPTTQYVHWPKSGARQNTFHFCISYLNLPIKQRFASIAPISRRKQDWKVLIVDVMVQLSYFIQLTYREK